MQLNDGWVFSDGTTYKTDYPPHGTIHSWTIIVPAPGLGTCSVGLPGSQQNGRCTDYRDCIAGVSVPSSTGCEDFSSAVQCCVPLTGALVFPDEPASTGTPVNTKYDGFEAQCIETVDCTGATFHNLCPNTTPTTKGCAKEQNPVWEVTTDFTLSKWVYNRLFVDVAGTPRGNALLPYLNHAIVQIAINSQTPKERCYKAAAFTAHVMVETDGLKHLTEVMTSGSDSYDNGRYRGRGAMHLTGEPADNWNNYDTMANVLKDRDIYNHPETVAFPARGFLTGVMYWYKWTDWKGDNEKCIELAGTEDYDEFVKLTRCIQGADGNLDDRWNYFQSLVEDTGCRYL